MVSMLVIPDLIGDITVTEWRRAADEFVTPVDEPTTIEVATLPGHDGEPQPIGGDYELITPGYAVACMLAAQPGRRWDIVVGVGVSGWAANVMVFGGHADHLALIDGLGDPWLTPGDRSRLRRARMRAIENDPPALAAHVGGGQDPRLRHGVNGLGSRSMALAIASSTKVPTLVISTGGRDADPGVVAAYSGGSLLDRTPPEPGALLSAVIEWWSGATAGDD